MTIKQLIPYKQAPKELQEKIKEKRKLYYPCFFKRFYIRLSKCFVRYEGVQRGFKYTPDHHMWTIIYNRKSNHRFNTTFLIEIT